MIKKSMRIAVMLLCPVMISAGFSASAAEPTLYLTEIGHIPLMPGTSVVENSGVVFDKPEGRIAETVLVTGESQENFLRYYSDALPPLGWTPVSRESFVNNTGVLTFEFSNKQGKTYISVRLVPRKKADALIKNQ